MVDLKFAVTVVFDNQLKLKQAIQKYKKLTQQFQPQIFGCAVLQNQNKLKIYNSKVSIEPQRISIISLVRMIHLFHFRGMIHFGKKFWFQTIVHPIFTTVYHTFNFCIQFSMIRYWLIKLKIFQYARCIYCYKKYSTLGQSTPVLVCLVVTELSNGQYFRLVFNFYYFVFFLNHGPFHKLHSI